MLLQTVELETPSLKRYKRKSPQSKPAERAGLLCGLGRSYFVDSVLRDSKVTRVRRTDGRRRRTDTDDDDDGRRTTTTDDEGTTRGGGGGVGGIAGSVGLGWGLFGVEGGEGVWK